MEQFVQFRPSWDSYFMLQAQVASLRSNCLTRQVGAVISKDKRQISTGYNGTPAGIGNCFEGGCERCLDHSRGKGKSGSDLDRCLCVHAEANAILQPNVRDFQHATLYTTTTPCMDCSKMIVSVGIGRVVTMLDKYPENAGKLFAEAGVIVDQAKLEDLEHWRGQLA